MGLIERRLIKLGKEEWVPGAQKDFEQLTTSKAAIEVDWTSFESDEEALKNLQNQGLRRIITAFRVVCRDELGKEAVSAALKKIEVKNVATPAEKSVAFEDGVFKVQGAYGKGSDGYFTDTDLSKVLERAL